VITYSQFSGGICLDDTNIGTGYSGFEGGLDNPAMEQVPDFGPIPLGQWQIVAWRDEYEDKGPCVAQLSPVGHDAFGRSGFLIHGDNAELNHTASHGCIIASHDIRQQLRDSGEIQLEVI
jgi:hypothetical protein